MFFPSFRKENVSNKTWNQILIKTQIFRVKNHSNNENSVLSLSLSPFRNKRNKHYTVETPSNATSNRCLHFHPHQTFIFRGNNFSVACKWHDISHFYRAASAWRPPTGISITEIAWFAYPTTTYRENTISSQVW